jgi:hypothetical protein
MQAQYWKFLVQLKADSIYTGQYVIHDEKINNGINIFNALVASGSVSTWAIWQRLDWLWAALVAATQVLSVLKQHLPFKKRIEPLRKTAYFYEELYIEAERKWHDVASGALSESEINKLLFDLKSKQSQAWKKNMDNLSIPLNPRIQRKSDEVTADYFRSTYSVEATIRP